MTEATKMLRSTEPNSMAFAMILVSCHRDNLRGPSVCLKTMYGSMMFDWIVDSMTGRSGERSFQWIEKFKKLGEMGYDCKSENDR